MITFNHESLRKQIYDYLRRQMDTGELRPGKMINQRELSEQLGVSRTPLRDTMIQLEAEGMVRIVPCRGIFIEKLSEQDICDYFQMAGALEGMAFGLALPYVLEEDFEKLEKNIAETSARIIEGDFSTCNEQNEHFHNTILSRCPNRIIVKSLSNIRHRLYHFPYRDPSPAAKWELLCWKEHEVMVELLKKGNIDELRAYTTLVHWRADKEYISARFDWICEDEVE